MSKPAILSIAFLALGACSGPYQLDEEAENASGVIGGLDLSFELGPSKYDTIQNAVGLFVVIDGGQVATRGVGTIVSLDDGSSLKILTAKHLVYDTKTKLKRAGVAVWMDDSSDRVVEIPLDKLAASIPAWGFETDFISLDISDIDGLEYVKIKSTPLLNREHDASCQSIEESTHLAFTSIASDYYFGPAWQAKTRVECHSNLEPPLLATDFDGFVGTSGSPVFTKLSNGTIQLLGIYVALDSLRLGPGGTTTCANFSENCRNMLLWLEPSDFR